MNRVILECYRLVWWNSGKGPVAAVPGTGAIGGYNPEMVSSARI